MLCQFIADSQDEGARKYPIILDDSNLLAPSQRVRVDRQLSEEVRAMSGIPQGSVLCPLLFLGCVDDIWRNTEPNLRLFADECIIYRKIMNSSGIDKLQTYLNRLEERTVENEMKIEGGKNKPVRFTKAG